MHNSKGRARRLPQEENRVWKERELFIVFWLRFFGHFETPFILTMRMAGVHGRMAEWPTMAYRFDSCTLDDGAQIFEARRGWLMSDRRPDGNTDDPS
jgi:hypothetical protein